MAKPPDSHKRAATAPPKALARTTPTRLLSDLRALIGEARRRAAQTVNSALVLLYWEVGTRLRTEVLGEKRAGYGEEILTVLAAKLVEEFGNGFGRRNLFN